MLYKLIRTMLANGNYDKDDLLEKLDIYLLADRVTKEQYDELRDLISGKQEG